MWISKTSTWSVTKRIPIHTTLLRFSIGPHCLQTSIGPNIWTTRIYLGCILILRVLIDRNSDCVNLFFLKRCKITLDSSTFYVFILLMFYISLRGFQQVKKKGGLNAVKHFNWWGTYCVPLDQVVLFWQTPMCLFNESPNVFATDL